MQGSDFSYFILKPTVCEHLSISGLNLPYLLFLRPAQVSILQISFGDLLYIPGYTTEHHWRAAVEPELYGCVYFISKTLPLLLSYLWALTEFAADIFHFCYSGYH